MKKEIVCGIYKITSPSSKIYIGQSINIYKRISSYKKSHCKNQIYLYRSILKYGWDSHKFEIIHKCKEGDLNKLEKHYVDLFQTFNSKNGLNLRDGGGNSGNISAETKSKIGIGNRGKKYSEETRRLISYKSSLKKLSPQHKKRFTFLGKNHSDEWKNKSSIRNSGNKNPMFGTNNSGEKNGMFNKKHSQETKDLMCKIILNVENGVFYIGVKSASLAIGMTYNQLRSRLNGALKNNTSFIYV